MKKSYHGNARPYAFTLYHSADESAVMPILEALSEKGLELCYGEPFGKSRLRRACALIAFVSANAVVGDALESAVLTAKANNVPVIPVKLDDTPLPDALNQLLFSSNSIPAGRYPAPAELAARIMTAESLDPPRLAKAQLTASKRLALSLIIGAVVIVLIAGFFVLRSLKLAAVEAEAPIETLPDVAGIMESGMTEEDLLAIKRLILVGDTRVEWSDAFGWDWHDVVLNMDDGTGTVWVVDEEKIPRGTITDISLIGRMENLEDLVLCGQSLTDISPLANLTKLRHIELFDVPVSDISPLGQIASLEQVDLHDTQVTDLSPLAACEKLRCVTGNPQCTGLDGLGHASMRELALWQMEPLRDISALAACTGLKLLRMNGLQNLTDISALAACASLTELRLEDCERLSSADGLQGCTSLNSLCFDLAPQLNNLSALSNMGKLHSLELNQTGVRDISGLQNAKALTSLHLHDTPVNTLDCLSGMTNLAEIELHNTGMRNFDFLHELGVQRLNLAFSGDFTDYSGLAAIKEYAFLHVNPRNRDASVVLPYLTEAKINTLQMYDCNDLDLTALPQVEGLQITEGNLQSLAGLDTQQNLKSLELDSLSHLPSLEGLPQNGTLTELYLRSCLRLGDLEPLYALSLHKLEMSDLLIAPDFTRLRFAGADPCLVLDNMQSVTDLKWLSNASSSLSNLTLLGMDQLNDLSPVKDSSVTYLSVPPQLGEQAEALVEEEVIRDYEVVYPEGESWETTIEDFELLSIEEIGTLPEALLSRVKELNLVGDHLRIPGEENWWYDWRQEQLCYGKNDTDEAIAAGPGVIDSLETLKALTGLEELELIGQPLTSLNGVEAFGSLRNLNAQHCESLSDISAAFTLTELETLSLFRTSVTSIQGVQNLSHLCDLDINNTQVTDLSPLAACDFSYASERGGLWLSVSSLPCEDYSPLATIPRFDGLNCNGTDAALWLDYIAGKPVRQIEMSGVQLTNEQLAIIAALPGLESINLTNNEALTDLTPLLGCDTLKEIGISARMEAAIASIQGKAQFTIKAED